MINFPEYTKYMGETKIALIDNSTVSFLEQLNRIVNSAKLLLNGYDVILIPQWVLEEIKDSVYRTDFINCLFDNGLPIHSIKEESYANIVNNEEWNLYKIVFAASSCLASLKSYLRRNVERQDPLDIVPFAEWFSELYQHWPVQSDVTTSGRLKKKNAGEVSLTILAEIFSWYYPQIETITIYTQDKDAYNYQTNAHKKLIKEFPERTPVDVSYKSNDFLLWKMYRDSKIDIDQAKELRKDLRLVIYTQVRSDQSVLLSTNRLDNIQFVELLKNQNCQIVF